ETESRGMKKSDIIVDKHRIETTDHTPSRQRRSPLTRFDSGLSVAIEVFVRLREWACTFVCARSAPPGYRAANPLMVRQPTLPTQQHVNAAIAIPTLLRCNSHLLFVNSTSSVRLDS
ncbi:hypothetical protein, partial [Pandoraea apista]|uniref:hypothetical protein n=1 Tax=Pandoraea apista TaxID=93218 RepID=UPI00406B92A8